MSLSPKFVFGLVPDDMHGARMHITQSVDNARPYVVGNFLSGFEVAIPRGVPIRPYSFSLTVTSPSHRSGAL